MHGRVTWYTSPNERTDEGIQRGVQGFKELLPKIQQLPGYVGCALLVDRDAAEAATIVYYRDQKALADSRALVKPMREAIQEQGAQVTRVEEYEITSMERAQPGTTGAWGRLITGTADPSRLDEGIAMVNQKSVPVLKQQPGFRSFIGGVNRENGAAFTGSTFDTREQLEASNAALIDARDEIRNKALIRDVKTQVFEIVVADVAATSGVRV